MPWRLQVHLPFASLQALAFPLSPEDRRVVRIQRIYPSPELSQLHPSGLQSRGCIIRFTLRPVVLAGTPLGWVKPAHTASRLGTMSGQVQPCVTTRARPLPTYPKG